MATKKTSAAPREAQSNCRRAARTRKSSMRGCLFKILETQKNEQGIVIVMAQTADRHQTSVAFIHAAATTVLALIAESREAKAV